MQHCSIFVRTVAVGMIAVGAAAAAIAQVRTADGGAGAAKPEPFYEHTVDLSRAFGLGMIERRLRIIETYETLNFELHIQVAKMATVDFQRFGGSLRLKDQALHDEMFIALWHVIQSTQAGKEVPAAIAKMRGLLARATELVLDPALQKDEVFRAAQTADLLIAGDGIAEAFEEMFVEPWEYANGVVALRSIKEQWAALTPRADETARAEAQAALAALDDLYRTTTPPDVRERRLTPEEAEAPAQRLAGIVEGVVGADLFPGRDFVRLAKHLHALTKQACLAYDNGDDDVGDEYIYAVGHHYGTQLSAFMELTEPQLAAGIVELMGMLVTVDDLVEGAEKAEEERERQRLAAALAALPPGQMLDDDDDENGGNPGWVICPDLEFLIEIAVGKLGG